jgi:hypothetical protein
MSNVLNNSQKTKLENNNKGSKKEAMPYMAGLHMQRKDQSQKK